MGGMFAPVRMQQHPHFVPPSGSPAAVAAASTHEVPPLPPPLVSIPLATPGAFIPPQGEGRMG